MSQRATLTLALCTASLFTIQAQWSRQDSIRLQQFLQGGSDTPINGDAVKSIEFNFTPKKEDWKGKPLVSEEKPWMKFLDDLPKNFGDTTKWTKPKYIRLTPYTPYTKWNEDPVNDPIFVLDDTLSMGKWVLRVNPVLGIRSGYRVLPAGMDQSVTPSNNPLGTFDADKMLYETFSKRGRSIRRNRNKAVAWKTYQDYVPTIESKELASTDSLSIIEQDTLKQKSEPLPIRTDSLFIATDTIAIRKESLLFRNDSLLIQNDSLFLKNKVNR